MARNQHEHPIRLRITIRKARAGMRCGPFRLPWARYLNLAPEFPNLAPVFPQNYACEHLFHLRPPKREIGADHSESQVPQVGRAC